MSDHDVELVRAVAVERARAEFWKRVGIAITTVIVTAILALVLVAIAEIRATQQTGSPVLRAILAQQADLKAAADAAVETNELLLACFDPESDCAKRTAARDAAQAGAYNAAVIAAHYCTDQLLPADYTERQLTTCVVARLDERE